MNKKIFSMFIFSFLLLASFLPVGLAHNAGFPPTYDSKTLAIDTNIQPETVDPAWAYDEASGEVIQNVYETLVTYENKWELGPYLSWQADSFISVLATSVPHMEFMDLPVGKVQKMTFTIRNGVTFSDGNLLTAADVEYSFERMLVQDRVGGPQWMIYYPLLGVYGASDPISDPSFGDKINDAIVSSSDTVTFYFSIAYPEKTWLQILSQTVGSVLEKSWAVGLGDFDANWSHSWQYLWNRWHDPGESFIERHAMGTGPYTLVSGSWWEDYVIARNVNYWQGWPAPVSVGSHERLPSYIETVVWHYAYSWTTERRSRFLTGNSDISYVERQYRDQVVAQPGIRAFYPLTDLSISAFFFNFEISTWSPFVGQMQPRSTFAENGIPPNLFSDVNVRKGFAYAFDYSSFLTTVYFGEGEQPSDPVIKGLLYDNPAQEKYIFDLSKATYYLKLAWGGVDANGNGVIDPINEPGDVEGSLWTNGMTFTLIDTPSSSVTPRQIILEILVKNINSLNPRFHLKIGWVWNYFPPLTQGEMPIFAMGWLADYPDADNFVFPFMHSQGAFAAWQKYNNPTVDDLISQGAASPDGLTRQQIYYDLQAIYHDDAPSVPVYQPIGRHFQRDWVRGWHYNPIFPENDVYHMWKAESHFADANNDGTVDVRDAAYVSSHWTAAGLPHNPAADLNGGKGGLTGEEYIRGIPDGVIDIVDIGLVSAYWDGPPQGPAHP